MDCRHCGGITSDEDKYCKFCGHALIKHEGRKRSYLLLVIVLTLMVGGASASAIFSEPLTAPVHSVFPIPSVNVCSISSSESDNTGVGTENRTTIPAASYDEQFILGFTQDFTSVLSYNISATAQNDPFGYGPSYLLNGYTDAHYWYQVGLVWSLPYQNLTGFFPGFYLVYEVWNPNGQSIFPSEGEGSGILSLGQVHEQDVILLSLSFQGKNLTMSGYDWNTGVRAVASFSSFGASRFLGSRLPSGPFFTGLMTEWYHVLPLFCSNNEVVYSSQGRPVLGGWMCIDEWNFSRLGARDNFDPSAGAQVLFAGCGSKTFVYYNNEETLQSYSLNGSTVYSNGFEFITT